MRWTPGFATLLVLLVALFLCSFNHVSAGRRLERRPLLHTLKSEGMLDRTAERDFVAERARQANPDDDYDYEDEEEEEQAEEELISSLDDLNAAVEDGEYFGAGGDDDVDDDDADETDEIDEDTLDEDRYIYQRTFI